VLQNIWSALTENIPPWAEEMKPFRRRKYHRLLLLILVAAIFILLVNPVQFSKDKNKPKVIAFVVDSASSMMEKERNTLDFFEDLTHGRIVSTILRRYGEPDEFHFYDVDDTRGVVDSERYLNALTLIKSYLRAKTSNRAVVNISLGSYSPRPQETKLIRDILELVPFPLTEFRELRDIL
jgi:hypothetical protein